MRGLDFQGPLNLPIFFLTGETAGLAMGQASGRAGGRTHERKQSPAETAAAFACGYASLKERQTMISLLAFLSTSICAVRASVLRISVLHISAHHISVVRISFLRISGRSSVEQKDLQIAGTLRACMLEVSKHL